jgi:hypothetical protein
MIARGPAHANELRRVSVALLPLIRVHATSDGRLLRNYRVGGLPPVDEHWWFEVLFDPRAQLPLERDIAPRSPNSGYRLDRQRGSTIEAECACGYRSRSFDKAMLLRELGPATNVIWAIRELMGCRNRNKVSNMCRATLVR